ncbi:MAG: hypothetical protein PHF57_12795 [Methanoregula sp.]|nr:hypothetical protein [Methanoregula sp.]MDD5023672.1 hypothetical protein [Methanoregula sp.]MDD5189075.1 hypothetical protein [Methanoregula sp.]
MQIHRIIHIIGVHFLPGILELAYTGREIPIPVYDLLQKGAVQRRAVPLALRLARHATIRCSRCVMVCPCFRTGIPEGGH